MNICLAGIPVGLAYIIRLLVNKDGSIRPLLKVPVFILGLAWLVFLPNTCYLLTEWRHFLVIIDYGHFATRLQNNPSDVILLMEITLFYFVFSATGVLAFALSIRPIARIAKSKGMNLWVWGSPFFLLMSIGVYLGLVLRFNSWDLLYKPGKIWTSMVAIASHPTLSLLIIAFAATLWLVYLVIDIWVDGFALRIRRR